MSVTSRRELLKDSLSRSRFNNASTLVNSLDFLFTSAETGEFNLAEADALDRKKIARIIRRATHRNVKRVIPVSLSGQDPDYPWMKKEIKFFGPWSGLAEVTLPQLGKAIDDEYHYTRREILGARQEISLALALGPYILSMFTPSIGLEPKQHPLNNLVNENLSCTVLYYAAFEVASFSEEATRLKALLDIWQECFPLGWHRRMPNTFIVAVK